MKPTNVPSADEVRERLASLSNAQLERLASMSGVPFHTLLKVRSGETGNPRLNTVHAFLPHVDKAAADRRSPASAGQYVHPGRRASDKPNHARG